MKLTASNFPDRNTQIGILICKCLSEFISKELKYARLGFAYSAGCINAEVANKTAEYFIVAAQALGEDHILVIEDFGIKLYWYANSENSGLEYSVAISDEFKENKIAKDWAYKLEKLIVSEGLNLDKS